MSIKKYEPLLEENKRFKGYRCAIGELHAGDFDTIICVIISRLGNAFGDYRQVNKKQRRFTGRLFLVFAGNFIEFGNFLGRGPFPAGKSANYWGQEQKAR